MVNVDAEMTRTHDVVDQSNRGQGAPVTALVYRKAGKRLFDIAFVVVFSPILVPLILLLALFVALDGGNPFYTHERIGLGGRRFRVIKLRSMVVDSERRLAEHLAENPDQKEIWEREYKLPDDPRVTVIGKLLRKTSLDELPQFFNVLRGEMSVVGPRPVTEPELRFYGARVQELLSVKPGVTGPWQVGGRNELLYHERVNLDIGYARTHTLSRDVMLVFGTVRAMLQRTGV